MKAILISDTQGKHAPLKLPQGDILIHAGDVSSRGELYEIEDLLS